MHKIQNPSQLKRSSQITKVGSWKSWLLISLGVIILCAGTYTVVVYLSRPSLNISAGPLRIRNIRYSSTFPPLCKGVDCARANPGYRFVIIRLEVIGKGDISGLFEGVTTDIYAQAGDGTKAYLAGKHLSLNPPAIYLAFGFKTSRRNFTLNFPGLPPIPFSPILRVAP